MTTVIVDLDVLADNRHRTYLAGGDTWDQYHAAASRDSIDPKAAFLVMAFARMGAQVFTISDRPTDKDRLTVEWLARHELPIVEAYGRAPGLTWAAHEVKSGLLKSLPWADFVIAEDERVAETARGLGAYVIQVSRL